MKYFCLFYSVIICSIASQQIKFSSYLIMAGLTSFNYQVPNIIEHYIDGKTPRKYMLKYIRIQSETTHYGAMFDVIVYMYQRIDL